MEIVPAVSSGGARNFQLGIYNRTYGEFAEREPSAESEGRAPNGSKGRSF